MHVSGQAWRKSLMEFSFSIVRSEEGRGFQDFHPENARDGMKPQREAFDYASFCAILLWDISASSEGWHVQWESVPPE